MKTLSKLGDPLQRLNKLINQRIFGPLIDEVFKNEDKDLSKGARPPFNRLKLFKAFIIQSQYNLSDDQLEYQIADLASFKWFLELKKSDKVLDNKTFWLFRERVMEQLLTEKDERQSLYVDSTYTGEDQEKVYKKKRVISKINEKGYRNKSPDFDTKFILNLIIIRYTEI